MNLDFLRKLGIEYPKVAVLSVAFAIGLIAVMWLIQPYTPKAPVNPYPFGSLKWFGWSFFNS